MDRLLRILTIVVVLLLVVVLGGLALRVIIPVIAFILRIAIGLGIFIFILWLISRLTRQQ